MMTDPKRPGRPPLVDDDTTTAVTVRLPSKLYDAMGRQAAKRRATMSHTLREALEQAFDAANRPFRTQK